MTAHAPIGLGLAPRTLLAAMAGIQHRRQSTLSLSVAGNGQRRSAATARSRVTATVLRARLSDRAINRF